MNPPNRAARAAIAARMGACADEVAREATDRFFARRPEARVRFGEAGVASSHADAGHHVRFLASALRSGERQAFEGYVQWTRQVLEDRNVPTPYLAEHLDDVRVALRSRLDEESWPPVAALLDAGLAIAGAARAPRGDPFEPSLQTFVHAAVNGRREPAMVVVRELLRRSTSVLDVYVRLLQEALYRVGRLWERNDITVAEEHMATAIVQWIVTRLYEELEPALTARGRAIIVGVRGELHQVGSHIVSDVLEADGWDVRFLGANIGHDGVLQAIDEHAPHVLGVSATMLFNVPQVARLVDAVRVRFGGDSPAVVFGGAAFRCAPDVVAELGGAGAANDLIEARNLLRGLWNSGGGPSSR